MWRILVWTICLHRGVGAEKGSGDASLFALDPDGAVRWVQGIAPAFEIVGSQMVVNWINDILCFGRPQIKPIIADTMCSIYDIWGLGLGIFRTKCASAARHVRTHLVEQ